MAVNILTATPINRVTAKPITGELSTMLTAKPVEDTAGDEGSNITIPDSRPGTAESQLQQPPLECARSQLLFHSLEDKHISIYCHTQGDNKASYSG